MKSPAFQFYPAEFLADENVALMSNQEIGCYIKLMCYCWREGSIPSDVSKLARLCGENGSAMTQLWQVIENCFEQAIEDASRLVHPRLEKERIKQQKHHEERAEAGRKGAKAKWGKDSERDSSAIAKPMAQPMANDGSSSSTSSSKSEPKGSDKPQRKKATPVIDCPDGVDPQVWADWLSLRKAKRAPVTPTVMNGAISEAQIAGMSLDAFLRVWCRRGSQGLEASWLKPEERAQVGAQRQGKFDPIRYVNDTEYKAQIDAQQGGGHGRVIDIN